jgi:hypothetical protein
MICVADECQSGTLACTRTECGYKRVEAAMHYPLNREADPRGGNVYLPREQADDKTSEQFRSGFGGCSPSSCFRRCALGR